MSKKRLSLAEHIEALYDALVVTAPHHEHEAGLCWCKRSRLRHPDKHTSICAETRAAMDAAWPVISRLEDKREAARTAPTPMRPEEEKFLRLAKWRRDLMEAKAKHYIASLGGVQNGVCMLCGGVENVTAGGHFLHCARESAAAEVRQIRQEARA